MKLSEKKLAGTDRLKPNANALPSMPTKERKEEEKKQEQPRTEAVKSVEKAPETAPAPVPAVKKAEEAPKAAPQPIKETAVKSAAPAAEKRKRGRPRIAPMKFDELSGQELINTNVLLEKELQDYLDFICFMQGGIAKREYVRQLVRKDYETHYNDFHNWKKMRKSAI